MAEFILKVTDSPIATGFINGDIIHAMNDLRIWNVHAQHVCHKNKIGFKGDGLRPANSLTEAYLSRVSQYRFERVSKTEVKRTELATLHEDILSDKVNVKGEYIHVAKYIKRRLQHPKHLIFGIPGREVWYGGQTSATTARINDIWAVIEARTAYRKANHNRWPFTEAELKTHLAIAVDDFDNAVSADLESPEVDMDGNVIKKRKFKVDWENRLALTNPVKNEIRNPAKLVDIRGLITFQRLNIVEEKTGG